MATVLGASTTARLAIPTGIDGSEVLKSMLASGKTVEQAVREAAMLIGATNQAVYDTYAGLFFLTDSAYAYQSQGATSRRRTPLKAEGSRPDPVRTESVGNMLPWRAMDDMLAWTVEYIKEAPQSQLDGDLQLIADSFWNRVGYDIWSRALTDNENAIGSSGYDVPWAIGTGTNVNFIPQQKPGFDPFDSTHTHFVFKDDDSKDWADLFLAMMIHLRHHGHIGTLSLFVSFDDIAEIALVDGWVGIEPDRVVVIGSGADNPTNPLRFARGEVQGMPGEVIGYWKCEHGLAEIRYNEHIPTNYAFMTKSYGMNHPKNGLAVRVKPNLYPGFGLMAMPTVTDHIEPKLKGIDFEGGHGVGVNDRTNGVCGYLASGAAAWADPTID